jgi:hypothetical protein
MADKLIFRPQKLLLSDLINSIPGGSFNKLVVVCVIKNIGLNRAFIELEAYASKSNGANPKGKFGRRVPFVPDPNGKEETFYISDYENGIALGNNELNKSHHTAINKASAAKKKKMLEVNDLFKAIFKTFKDEEKLTTAAVSFTPTINSPLQFDVNYDGVSAKTNPSPPYDPS